MQVRIMGMRLLFIGDSLTEFFDWTSRFQEHAVHNLGIAGETVEGLYRRLPGVCRRVGQADCIFIMSGINNLSMEDKGFIGTYRRIVRDLADCYPSARIFVQSLLPALYPFISNADVDEMNVLLKGLAQEEGAGYLDIHSLFLGEDGRPDPSLLDEDGVHLSGKGYIVWSGEIERLLRRQ